MAAMLSCRLSRCLTPAARQTRCLSSYIGSSIDDPKIISKRSTFQNYLAVTNGKEAISSLQEILMSRDPEQTEFLDTASEMLKDLEPIFDDNLELVPVFRYIMEPERVIKFRVPWINDHGIARVNRGYRIQYSSALGPYTGGLRFHPTVSESIVKFLGFEQTFKSALSTIPLGGGKGGADFDPKGKSESEIVRFCQSFMTELSHYIGALKDIPSGDIGVGPREIGYLFGQYKRMTRLHEGVLTGKNLSWGGSSISTEAHGYGCVLFALAAIEAAGDSLQGKRCVISGSGNVALYCAEKLLQVGAIPISFSDSNGTIHEPDGFTEEGLQNMMFIKNEKRGRVADYRIFSVTSTFKRKATPWSLKCDYVFPCATQNELDESAAKQLVENGCKGVFEGSNKPCTLEAIKIFQEAKVIFAPSKATNAGGVAVTGSEMSQNAQMSYLDRATMEKKLGEVMINIHNQCAETAEAYGRPGDLKFGANTAAFLKVAVAVHEQGV